MIIFHIYSLFVCVFYTASSRRHVRLHITLQCLCLNSYSSRRLHSVLYIYEYNNIGISAVQRVRYESIFPSFYSLSPLFLIFAWHIQIKNGSCCNIENFASISFLFAWFGFYFIAANRSSASLIDHSTSRHSSFSVSNATFNQIENMKFSCTPTDNEKIPNNQPAIGATDAAARRRALRTVIMKLSWTKYVDFMSVEFVISRLQSFYCLFLFYFIDLAKAILIWFGGICLRAIDASAECFAEWKVESIQLRSRWHGRWIGGDRTSTFG